MGEGQFTVFITLYLLFLYILLPSLFMVLHCGGGILNHVCCNTVYSDNNVYSHSPERSA